jgi:hypothetical protein
VKLHNYHRRRALGLCGYGGCSALSARSYCDAHMEQISRTQVEMRKRRIAAGVCTTCGAVEVEGDPLCDDCRLVAQLVARQAILRKSDGIHNRNYAKRDGKRYGKTRT